ARLRRRGIRTEARGCRRLRRAPALRRPDPRLRSSGCTDTRRRARTGRDQRRDQSSTRAAVTRLVVLSAIGLVLCAGAGSSALDDRNQQAAIAFVSRRCAPSSTRDATLWVSGWVFNALFGDCGGGDGHDQNVWFFTGKRFVGMDARKSSAEIIGLWRDDTVLAFLYVLYRPDDALCC